MTRRAEDYYAVLGVEPGADAETIQAAYRALSKRYHPDAGHPDASLEIMIQINEAYAVLSDEMKRRAYDAGRGTPAGARARAPRAPRRPADRIIDLGPGLAIPLVRVPAGDFLMGSCVPGACHATDGARCARYPLRLPAYYIGVFPVTVAQYAAFAGATGRPAMPWARRAYAFDSDELDDPETIVRLDRNWRQPFGTGSSVAEKRDHPVTIVSWFDAVAFCRWASAISGVTVRLPTAAEWQKAARGEDGRCYPWGDAPAPNPALCNCLAEPPKPGRSSTADTTPVGAFSPHGDSPYGCADMLGNIWEWTSTRTRNKEGALLFGDPYRPDDGREDPSSRDYRLLLGGSYQSVAATICCAGGRDQDPLRARDTGFRVCVSDA